MASGFNRSRKPYTRPTVRPRATDDAWVHDKAPFGTAVNRNGTHNVSGEGHSAKLLVSNLHYEITPKDLTSIFGQIGTLVREPLIKYDRSGRSTGVAIISYETADEASRAKTQYDGALAKGQVMSITYDTVPTPALRKVRRSSAPSSLINRIQKPALLDRLSRDDSHVRPAAASKVGPGPIRARVRGPRPGPKKPRTAEDLDKELDAFMTDGTDPSAPALTGQSHGDVDMV